MPTISVYNQVVLDLGSGPSIVLGSRETPTVLSVSGYEYRVRKSLAVTTTWSAWSAGSASLTDFDFCYIMSDLDGVQVELTTDVGNDVGDEYMVVTLKAGVPLILGADDGIANYTVNWGAGTADVIDRIRVRNPSAVTAANVDFLLVT